jgi:2-keto-3-deoxy-L-arabinonate dehydratase
MRQRLAVQASGIGESRTVETLRGIIPIVVTTFHEDGSLDLESQRRLIHHLLSQRVHALALFGNASEGYSLTNSEREELLALTVKEVHGKVPVIASTGHNGTHAAVELSRAAEKAGADALMVLPPFYVKPDAQEVYDYFAAISRAVHLPIMVQDAPLMTQVPMPAALLTRMGNELENVRFVKVEAPPTAPKITSVLQQANGNIALFGGLNGNFLIEELDRGSVGVMPGSDLCGPFLRLWNAYQAGDRAAARSEFQKILPLIRYELQPGLGVSVMKLNLQARGIIDCAAVRPPTKTVDAIGVKEAAELREELGLDC